MFPQPLYYLKLHRLESSESSLSERPFDRSIRSCRPHCSSYLAAGRGCSTIMAIIGRRCREVVGLICAFDAGVHLPKLGVRTLVTYVSGLWHLLDSL